jgi:glucose/arabinose dehydrogenase
MEPVRVRRLQGALRALRGRPPEDFLTGFIANEKAKEVYGRPCGVAVLPDGSLLVADDAGNKIWRVQAAS